MKKVSILFFILFSFYCNAQSFNFDDFKQIHFYSFEEANTRLINENFVLSSSGAFANKTMYAMIWKYYSPYSKEEVFEAHKLWENTVKRSTTYFSFANPKLLNSIKAECLKSGCTLSKQYDDGLEGFTTVYECDIYEIKFSVISEELRKNSILHQNELPYKITFGRKE